MPRPTVHIDRMTVACFVLGLSTRKADEALLAVLGRPPPPSHGEPRAHHPGHRGRRLPQRTSTDRYGGLTPDGVVLKRKSGCVGLRQPLLPALQARRQEGGNRLPPSECRKRPGSGLFLIDLYRRGLTGESLEPITVDCGSDLLAALPTVSPSGPGAALLGTKDTQNR